MRDYIKLEWTVLSFISLDLSRGLELSCSIRGANAGTR
jgi:hypothetical protein